MDDFVKMVEATLKDDRDRFFNFFSLVRRMREAQKREWEIKSKQTCGKELDEHTEIVTKLESEVDEYLGGLI